MSEKQELLEELDKQIDGIQRMLLDINHNHWYRPTAENDIKKLRRIRELISDMEFDDNRVVD